GFSSVASAQNIQHTSAKSDFTKRSDLRVAPSTLGLNIQIPLGNYPGRGGNDLSVSLFYASKVHRIHFLQGPSEGDSFNTWAEPRWGENTAAGWTHSLAVPTGAGESTELYDSAGAPKANCSGGCWLVRHIQIIMPDGSSHDLRHGVPIVNWPGGQPAPSFSGTYYAVDGSQLRYEYNSRELFLPNGSRYVL